MKFGKTFPNHQVPEWSHQYVNYKSLKKLIKQINHEQEKLYRLSNGNNKGEGQPPVKTRDSNNIQDNFLDDSEVKNFWPLFSLHLIEILRKLITSTMCSFWNMKDDCAG